ARGASQSKYTFKTRLSLACAGLFTCSDAPLRLATWVGGLVAAASLAMGIMLTIWHGSILTMIAAGVFFLGGVQLLCLGILGEYIGRIHTEVKGRPAFVVEALVGFEREQSVSLNGSAKEGTLAGASG